MDYKNFDNQVFDELPESVVCSNFTDCTFNASSTFDRCNIRKCTFTKTQKFVRSNIIACTGYEGSEFDKSNVITEEEEELMYRHLEDEEDQ